MLLYCILFYFTVHVLVRSTAYVYSAPIRTVHGSKKRAPSQPDVSMLLDSLDATDGVNALELKGSNTAAAKAQMAKFKKLFNIRTDPPYARLDYSRLVQHLSYSIDITVQYSHYLLFFFFF